MMINLEKFVERNKKIDELRAKALYESELNEIVVAVIEGKKDYFTSNKKIVDKLKIKVKKRIYTEFKGYFPAEKEGYKIELNEENIKKINDLLNKEGE